MNDPATMQHTDMPQTIMIIDRPNGANDLIKRSIDATNPTAELRCHANGFAALQQLSFLQLAGQLGNWPELIFVNLNMPEFNGWDFLDHFEEIADNEHRPIKIVLLASQLTEHVLTRFERYSHLDVELAQKPVTAQDLSALLLPAKLNVA